MYKVHNTPRVPKGNVPFLDQMFLSGSRLSRYKECRWSYQILRSLVLPHITYFDIYSSYTLSLGAEVTELTKFSSRCW